MAKKKCRNEPISVSKIYETIQARDFLRELWWDLISDIQEKPTYKRLKAMVNDAINNTMKNFTSKSVDKAEELKRRNALTEISIMTYTVDTVISEVLYRRYENEYESIVKNIIEDLLKDNKKETSTSGDDSAMLENIESIFNKEANKENSRLKGIKTELEDAPETTDSKKSLIQNSENDVENSATIVRKRGRPKKITVDKISIEKAIAPPTRKRGRPPKNVNKSVPERRMEEKTEKLNMAATESLDCKTKRNSKVNDQESDAESELSVGNLSIDSVSSVHTSELSSFEDTISIYSGDEGEKKHVSLKVANEMYLRGKLSQIYHIGNRGERYKLMQNAPCSSSKYLSKTDGSSSTNVNSPSKKVLPQRIRKPNSKYNSETMYCEVKDYSSPPPDTGSSSSQDEYDNKLPKPTKKQRKRKRSSLDKRIVSSSTAKRGKTNNSPVSKASTKRYDTSDLYKPHAVTGSTLGSRSTAVTVCST